MHSLANRGVPLEEHPGAAPNELEWDNVRAFLEVVRRGSIRAAARFLGVSINTIARRIDRLEQELSTKLITRHIGGINLTAEGAEILAAAREMERASFSLIRARDRTRPEMAGELRLATTEALGSFWLGPRLVEFRQAHPKLLVDLNCAMRSADVLRLEADASIQLTRPSDADLKAVRVGRIHSMPAASPAYLDRYGVPKSLEELRAKHRLTLQFADQTGTQELYERLFPGVPYVDLVAFRTNSSSALLWSLIKGAGIGWAPTYIHAIGPQIVPVDIDPSLIFGFDVWLSYHPDAARIPRVRRLIDWVKECFSAARYPWFRDEFIHPRDLPGMYDGPPLVNLFQGVTWSDRSQAGAA